LRAIAVPPERTVEPHWPLAYLLASADRRGGVVPRPRERSIGPYLRGLSPARLGFVLLLSAMLVARQYSACYPSSCGLAVGNYLEDASFFARHFLSWIPMLLLVTVADNATADAAPRARLFGYAAAVVVGAVALDDEPLSRTLMRAMYSLDPEVSPAFESVGGEYNSMLDTAIGDDVLENRDAVITTLGHVVDSVILGWLARGHDTEWVRRELEAAVHVLFNGTVAVRRTTARAKHVTVRRPAARRR